MTWYEREKDKFLNEKKVWGNLGFCLDSTLIEEEQKVMFKGIIPYEEVSYEFEVHYPEGYPYIAPSVRCLNEGTYLHKSPSSNILCWHEEWKDYGLVGAKDVFLQLRKWVDGLHEGFSSSEVSKGHIEPSFYENVSSINAILLTPPEVFEKWTETDGVFLLNLQTLSNSIQAELVKINSANQKWVTHHSVFKDGKMYQGFCVNVSEAPPFFEDSEILLSWLKEQTGFDDISKRAALASKKNPDLGPLIGIRYPKDGTYHFLVVALEESTMVNYSLHLKYFFMVVFKTEILSREHLFSRVAHLHPLHKKQVVVVGLGAIGSPIALELAKAGIGKLTLVDHDYLSAGNVVRHVANFKHIGLSKVEAVQEVCLSHNPYLKIRTREEYWGIAPESEVINILEEADLVICCTGHSPTERYINDVARRRGVPVLYAYSSLGATSGRVFVTEGNDSGCYHCHQYAIDQGRVPALVQPEQTIEIYEEGCAGPSFLGSGIDTGTIALQASRLALQTLLKNDPASYEVASYNHLVWISQNGKGRTECIQNKVTPEQDCPYC